MHAKGSSSGDGQCFSSSGGGGGGGGGFGCVDAAIHFSLGHGFLCFLYTSRSDKNEFKMTVNIEGKNSYEGQESIQKKKTKTKV